MITALERQFRYPCIQLACASAVRCLTSSSVSPPSFHKPVPAYDDLPSSWSVLGGSGMLGAALVDFLLEAGAQSIKVLDLKPYKGRYAGDSRITNVVGSISNRNKVDEAVQGANTVVAAVTPHIPTATWNQFVSVNVHGTQTALSAAAAAGSKAFVAVSSIAVNSHFVEHDNASDTLPLPDLSEYRSAYDLTKRLGEDLVLQANSRDQMRTVALRPGGILMGPHDYTLGDIFRRNVAYFEGKPIDFTYSRNVCHAILLAAVKLQDPATPVQGRALTVSKGKAVALGQLSRDLGKRLKKDIRILPSAVMAGVSAGSIVSSAIVNERTPHKAPAIPTHRFLSMANYMQSYQNTLAQELLGFEPLYSYEETLDTIVAEYHMEAAGKALK